MTMYTIAGMSLSEDEFARASQVSIGKSLDPAVVHTVFKIFDRDGKFKKIIWTAKYSLTVQKIIKKK